MKKNFTHSTKLLVFVLLNLIGYPSLIFSQTGPNFSSDGKDLIVSKIIKAAPSITITKDGTYEDTNKDGITNVGDNIIYSLIVTNTGNVKLTNIAVTNINAIVYGTPIALLEVGDSDNNTYRAVHAITQEEIDAGVVYNLATVIATPPDGSDIIETSTDPTPYFSSSANPYCPNCTITDLVQKNSITITEDGTYEDTNNDGMTNVGDNIIYKYVITNKGNTTLNNVYVTNINAVVFGRPISSLEVGQSDINTFTSIHAITQEEIDNGVVYNLATVSATPPKGLDIADTSTDPTLCLSCPINPYCPDCTITTLDNRSSIASVKNQIHEDVYINITNNISEDELFKFVSPNNITLKN